MAIKLEFCNMIVPVDNIRAKLGDEAFESEFSIITDTNWHDGFLFRDGCMNEYDLKAILDEWQSRGFELLTVPKCRCAASLMHCLDLDQR